MDSSISSISREFAAVYYKNKQIQEFSTEPGSRAYIYADFPEESEAGKKTFEAVVIVHQLHR